MRKSLILFAAAVLVFAQGTRAQSAPDNYPNKPIHLILPFAASGGAGDLLARNLGQKLSESMGQPVIVEYRGGASGAIAAEVVKKAAPDGYTLLLGVTQTHGINPAVNPNLPYDPVKDFTPISLIGTVPHVLVVNKSVKANSLAEFVRAAKANPNMAYGSSGTGSPHHLAIEMFKAMAGFKALHVPYRGSGPAMLDLIGGQIQFMSVELITAEPYVEAGKLKALAIATEARVPGIDLPTFVESGYPGFEVVAWYAIFGPAGVPEPVVSRLHDEIVKAIDVMKKPKGRERSLKTDPILIGGTPAELAAHVRAELARWGKAAKEAGLKHE